MREHRKDKGRLQHILEYSDYITQFVNNLTVDEFVNDKRTIHSVAYDISIIGEASNMLTRDFKETHPELPWAQIIKMRNILIHGYFLMTEKEIYNVAVGDIPELRKHVKRYIEETDWNEWEAKEDTYSDMDNTVFKKTMQTAHNLKKLGTLTSEQIAEATGLTIKEVEDIEN